MYRTPSYTQVVHGVLRPEKVEAIVDREAPVTTCTVTSPRENMGGKGWGHGLSRDTICEGCCVKG
jgi:hypothetical protein